VRRGIALDAGGGFLLPRHLGLHKAKELVFFGDDLTAQDAERLGLVNKVVPAAELEKTVREWAERLAQGPTFAIGLSKRILNRSLQADIDTLFAEEAFTQALVANSEDMREGIRSFMEKRRPPSGGVERAAHRGAEIRDRERLAEKPGQESGVESAGRDLVAVAAHQDHARVRADVADRLEHLVAAETRQRQVDDDASMSCACARKTSTPLASVARLEDAAPEPLEHVGRHSAHVLLVVDEEDGAAFGLVRGSRRLRRRGGCRGASTLHGRYTRNVVPRPGSLSTRSAPRCPRTTPRTVARPNPRPVVFVVKNGSKMRAIVAASMPQPLSATSRQKCGPGDASGAWCVSFSSDGRRSTAPVRTVIAPPRSPRLSTALMTRFITTWRICVASASTAGRSSEDRR
jgi:hypothetical protein